MAPCVTAGGGGGMLGGVDLGCVFTSAGESGMVAARVSALSAEKGHGAVSGVCAGQRRASPPNGHQDRGRGDTWGPWGGLGISTAWCGTAATLGPGRARAAGMVPGVLYARRTAGMVQLHNGGDGALCPAWMQGGGDRSAPHTAQPSPAHEQRVCPCKAIAVTSWHPPARDYLPTSRESPAAR